MAGEVLAAVGHVVADAALGPVEDLLVHGHLEGHSRRELAQVAPPELMEGLSVAEIGKDECHTLTCKKCNFPLEIGCPVVRGVPADLAEEGLRDPVDGGPVVVHPLLVGPPRPEVAQLAVVYQYIVRGL